MDILKRTLAPVTDEAWAVIDAQATRTLKGNLSARRLVDFSGPHGPHCAAVNLGLVKPGKAAAMRGVDWGIRQVQPLIEVRVPFTLELVSLDSVTRGNETPELRELEAAARLIALFEETAVYKGFAAAGMQGILGAATGKPVALPAEPPAFVEAVEVGIAALQGRGIGGPYALALGRAPYLRMAAGDIGGYPLRRRIEELLGGGGIHWTPALDAGVVLSTRKGDYELTVGQDLAVGYQCHEEGRVGLFLMESFAFRVCEPAAAVAFV